MDLVSVQCPRCGAELPPREPTGEIHCEYCNGNFQVGQAKAAHTVAGVKLDVNQLAQAIVQAQQAQGHAGQGQAGMGAPSRLPGHAAAQYTPNHQQASQQAYAHATVQAGGAARRIVFSVAALGLVSAAVPAVVIMAQTGALENVPGMDQISDGLKPAEHLLWDHVVGEPVFADVGGTAIFLGRTRTVLDNDSLYIDAYDAASVARRWRIGPLGSYSEAYQHAVYAVAGDKLAVADAKAQVHVHDLATGERLNTIKLTDKVDFMCGPQAGEGEKKSAKRTGIWLKQIDEKSIMLDVGSGKLTEAERPEDCPESKWAGRRRPRGWGGGDAEAAPKVEGVEVQHVVVDGDLGIAVGVKAPGTPVPRVVGFSPADLSVTFNEVIASVDAATVRKEDLLVTISDGRVFVTYGSGQEDWHLAAFDAATGARIWEQKLRPVFAVDSLNGLSSGAGRVLLGRTSSLEVYDVTDGKLVGTIGKETYD